MTRSFLCRRLCLLHAVLALVVTLATMPAPVLAQQRGQGAQDGQGRQTGQATTLEDILERQRRHKLGLDLERPPTVRTLPPAVLTPPLAAQGGQADADMWRAIKAGDSGNPSSSTATGTLIRKLGEDWRLLRSEVIVRYAGWILLATLGLIALFYLIRGQIRIRGGRAGTTIKRFTLSHRVAHWFLACCFILMALSGLIILLGRPVLIPLIGKDANAVLASAALQSHNLFGLVFILALLIVIVRFMRGNFFQWADFGWIIRGGGLLGGHASSHHYNFGEKTWYWVVVLVGLMLSATGLLLLFPWLTDDLLFHQTATVLHAVGAIGMICFALGHIYIGSIGMEGSLDSMLRGEVDENWAREHHDLWYEEVTGKPAGHDDGTATATAEGKA